ncbi:hypothetical protein Trydic_g3921 [Trypoxylus dichotomus]
MDLRPEMRQSSASTAFYVDRVRKVLIKNSRYMHTYRSRGYAHTRRQYIISISEGFLEGRNDRRGNLRKNFNRPICIISEWKTYNGRENDSYATPETPRRASVSPILRSVYVICEG